jgi:WD40 repeat protein
MDPLPTVRCPHCSAEVALTADGNCPACHRAVAIASDQADPTGASSQPHSADMRASQFSLIGLLWSVIAAIALWSQCAALVPYYFLPDRQSQRLFVITTVAVWFILGAFHLSRGLRGIILVHGVGPLLMPLMILLSLLITWPETVQKAPVATIAAGFFASSTTSFLAGVLHGVFAVLGGFRKSPAEPAMARSSFPVSGKARRGPLFCWLASYTVLLLLLLGTTWYSVLVAVPATVDLDELAPAELSPPVRSASRICEANGVKALAFTTDSKYLATTGGYQHIKIWSTGDWMRAQGLEHEDNHARFLGSLDGGSLFTAADRVDGFPGGGPHSALTPDREYLIAIEDAWSRDLTGEPFVVSRSDGLIVSKTPFANPHKNYVHLAVSPDGRYAVASDSGPRLFVYRIPGLELSKEIPLSSGNMAPGTVWQVTYPPNGEWLAVADPHRSTPHLIDTKTSAEIMPYEGNGSAVIDLRFSADYRTIRSIGSDGSICIWDAATEKMLSRKWLPSGSRLESNPTSDGRYGFCWVEDDAADLGLVVDLDSGGTVGKLRLPVRWDDRPDVTMLNDTELLVWSSRHLGKSGEDEPHLWRINYRTGATVAEQTIDYHSRGSSWYDCGRGELTEDGTKLIYIHDGGKRSPPSEVGVTDLATFSYRELGVLENCGLPDAPSGLVPGGKYLHLGTHIYDRRSLRRVATRELPDKGVEKLVFSDDGSRYAAFIWKPRAENDRDWYRRRDPTTEAQVRVQDAPSGRTLLAYAPPAGVWQFRFSADGQRLATAYDDGTIEVRALPAADGGWPAERLLTPLDALGAITVAAACMFVFCTYRWWASYGRSG